MRGVKRLSSFLVLYFGLQWQGVWAFPANKPKCEKNEFLCSNGNCIIEAWKCDGEDDCGDKSDEQSCKGETPRPCNPLNNFRCGNGRCIPKKWTCDKANDCGDNTDESTINDPKCSIMEGCPEASFQCKKTKSCLKRAFRCDGQKDCGSDDLSDEEDCDERTCRPDEFKCANGRCITQQWRCDKRNDCGDKSDEANCSQAICGADQFKCKHSGHCILNMYRCDGQPDCLDSSDEAECNITVPVLVPVATKPPATTASPVTTKPAATNIPVTTGAAVVTTPKEDVTCKDSQYQCKSDHSCVFKTWLCDGEPDCEGGEDESDEMCKVLTCTDKEFKCNNGKCIRAYNRCDGTDQCGDGSDEHNCTTLPPRECAEENMYECHMSTKCIGKAALCDKKTDCPKGDDESELCGRNECEHNNGGCDQNCKNKPIGFKCSCDVGYKLNRDGKTCSDINECATAGFCSQKCTNEKGFKGFKFPKDFEGFFKCECANGYSLGRDRKTCRANGALPMLFFSNRIDIRQISTTGKDYKPLVQNVRSVVAISVNQKDDVLYWADNVNKTISQAPLRNLNNAQVIVSKDVQKPEAVAIDWIGRKIYWSDSQLNRIEVANLDGSSRLTLKAGQEDEQIRTIAVFPQKSMIFWTDWGKSPKIVRANLDGTDEKTIISSNNVTWPNGIKIDSLLERIFWVDMQRAHICSSKLDGTDIKLLVHSLNHPYGLAVFEDYIFWSDYKGQKLYKANKFTGAGVEEFKETFFAPLDLTVYHPLMQPKVVHPCQSNNGGCSHLCLISPTKARFSCRCPTGVKLLMDGKTCKKTAPVPTERPALVSPETPVDCAIQGMYTCQITGACLARKNMCDGKPDCAQADDEDSELCFSETDIPSVLPVGHAAIAADVPEGNNQLYMIIGVVIGVSILVVLIVVLVINKVRKAKSRFDLQMVYDHDTQQILKDDDDDDEGGDEKAKTMKKYTALPNSLLRKNSSKSNKNKDTVNFENVNFVAHSPAAHTNDPHVPLQMSDIDSNMIDNIYEQSDESSDESEDFSETAPVIRIV